MNILEGRGQFPNQGAGFVEYLELSFTTLLSFTAPWPNAGGVGLERECSPHAIEDEENDVLSSLRPTLNWI
jgi:hypothetical protein